MKTDKNDSNRIIKLKDVAKQSIFTTPDDYFDNLPGIIQSRVAEKTSTRHRWQQIPVYARLAIPAFVMLLIAFYLGLKPGNSPVSVQAMIDEISTQEMIDFIHDSDITTDELLAMVDLENLDIDNLQEEDIHLLNDDEWDEILDDFEFMNQDDSI